MGAILGGIAFAQSVRGVNMAPHDWPRARRDAVAGAALALGAPLGLLSIRHAIPLSILLVDVDRLKALNDRHGHRVGDEALSRVAAAIRSGSRAMDVAARWGGDEFALLAPDTGREEALHLAERVRALVAGSGERTEAITVSVRVVTLDAFRPVADPEVLMRAADVALYEAKRQGRNRIVAAR